MLSIETETAGKLSPAVLYFAFEMQNKLDANEHKGLSWTALTRQEIKARIREELVELDKALCAAPTGNSAAVTREAADIANFALFAALLKGKL